MCRGFSGSVTLYWVLSDHRLKAKVSDLTHGNERQHPTKPREL